MQLNYSRALGGKDLVPYGLSAVPDISTISITSADRVLVVASDGLWDVCSPEVAVEHALRSHEAGRNPSAELAQYACVVFVSSRLNACVAHGTRRSSPPNLSRPRPPPHFSSSIARGSTDNVSIITVFFHSQQLFPSRF